MKKTVSVFLSILLIFSLFGCAAQKDETASSQSISQTEASAQTTLSQPTFSTTESTAESTESQTILTTETTAKPTEPQTTKEKTTEASTKSTTKKETTTYTATESDGITCLVTIDCRNIQNNLSSLKKEKKSFVPKSGYILKEAEVTLDKGATAFGALKKACKENVCTDNCKYCQKSGIQLEFSYTPAYESYYVEGIHQLYEKDCGSLSGWMYNVNGTYPDVSSSVFEVKSGDKITFAYTVSMGDDL